jgi:transposase-like protein
MRTPSTNHYKHHRFPAEIISHAVWLYFRFCLGYRDAKLGEFNQEEHTVVGQRHVARHRHVAPAN